MTQATICTAALYSVPDICRCAKCAGATHPKRFDPTIGTTATDRPDIPVQPVGGLFGEPKRTD